MTDRAVQALRDAASGRDTVLDLGGGIRVHPGILTPELIPIDAITPHPRNPRQGDEEAIAESIDTNGLFDQVKAQTSTGYILAGNHTYRTLRHKGAHHVPGVWLDVDDTEAARIMAAANRTADRGSYDAKLMVQLLREDLTGDTTGTGYTPDEYALMIRAADDPGPVYIGADTLLTELHTLTDAAPDPDPDGPVYTRRTDAIRYEPTSAEPPPVESLVDTTRADRLMTAVHDAHDAGVLPDGVADFLIAGAMRHLVFDYAQIAEFYAHATPEVQALMEASALVLVDFNDAIHHGYVRLSTRLADLLDVDLQTRAELDAAGALDEG